MALFFFASKKLENFNFFLNSGNTLKIKGFLYHSNQCKTVLKIFLRKFVFI